MPDEQNDPAAEEARERRNKRYARIRRDLKAWLDPILVPLIIGSCAALQFMWPLGVALITILLLAYGFIAYLSIAPQLRLSNKAILIAVVTLALSLALLFSGLGEIAELSASLLLTAWIVTLCVHCANAVKAERAKNPD